MIFKIETGDTALLWGSLVVGCLLLAVGVVGWLRPNRLPAPFRARSAVIGIAIAALVVIATGVVVSSSDVNVYKRQLRDPLWSVRRDAVESLAEIAKTNPKVGKLLAEAVRDSREEVQIAAVQGLYEAGPDVDRYVVPLLDDPDVEIRGIAVAIFAARGEAPPAAVDGLIRALEDGFSDVPGTAATLLGRLGSRAKKAIPALGQSLQHDARSVARAAAEALVTFGQDAVPVLVEALDNPDWYVRASAVHSLKMIGPDAKAAADPLANRAIRDSDEDVRYGAIAALQALFGSSDEAARAVLRALDDDRIGQTHIRLGMELLADLEPSPTGISSELRPYFRHSSPPIRDAALYVAGRMGPDAAPLLNDVRELLHDWDADVRERAVHTLRHIGAADEEVVADLRRLTEDPLESHWVRLAAALFLIEHAPAADLLATVYDLSEYVPTTASRSLLPHLLWAIEDRFTIQPPAGAVAGWSGEDLSLAASVDASRRLLSLLEYPDADVRWAAEGALARIGEHLARTEPYEDAAGRAVYALLTHPDIPIGLREQMSDRLAAHGDAVVPLAAELFATDPDLWFWASRVLMDVNSPAVIEAMESMFTSDNPKVRADAVHVLMGLSLELPGMEDVIRRGLQDPDPIIVERVAARLGWTLDKEIQAQIIHWLRNDPSPAVRAGSANALARMILAAEHDPDLLFGAEGRSDGSAPGLLQPARTALLDAAELDGDEQVREAALAAYNIVEIIAADAMDRR